VAARTSYTSGVHLTMTDIEDAKSVLLVYQDAG